MLDINLCSCGTNIEYVKNRYCKQIYNYSSINGKRHTYIKARKKALDAKCVMPDWTPKSPEELFFFFFF